MERILIDYSWELNFNKFRLPLFLISPSMYLILNDICIFFFSGTLIWMN